VRPARGFTLIEVLVVIAIAATMTALVVLRLGSLPRPDDPEWVLDRLAARIDHQCEQALFQARPRGLRISELGYEAWQSSAEGWRALPQSGADQAQAFPEGLAVELELAGYPVDLSEVDTSLTLEVGQVQDVRPQIICHPLGELTPFRLTLSLDRDRWALEGEASGRLIRPEPGS